MQTQQHRCACDHGGTDRPQLNTCMRHLVTWFLLGCSDRQLVAAGSSIGGASIRIGGGNKRPSPESTSAIEIDGDSDPKKSRVKRHVFTPLEKEILVNLYNTNKVKDKKDIHDVVLLLSKDERSLSETLVKTWVDNYKSSLNRKQSEKDNDHKDEDQE